MALDSYTNLKIAIADWMHRSDLTSYLDDFIGLTEGMFRHPPRRPDDPEIGGVRVEITTATGTLTSGQDNLAKPAGYLDPYSFDLTGASGGRVEFLSPADMHLHYLEGSGRPRFWTVTDNIDLNISPDADYAYELKYFSQPDAIDGVTTTNTVLTNYPQVYLSGCLHHAHQFIHNDQAAGIWLNRYKGYAWAASQAFKRGLISQGSIAASVA